MDPQLNFTNGPLVVGALGNPLAGHMLGGVRLKHIVVREARARPVLLLDGTGSKGLQDVQGDISVYASSPAGCEVEAGGWGSKPIDSDLAAQLRRNVSVLCHAEGNKP